ncbi:MAG TPA: S8 family serine peptidase, partial [Myxococcota bacterium]|nr:S8 family serine peptidase [Myxococcota bacterium]
SCPKNHAFERNYHPATIINASFGFAGSYLKEPAYGPVLDVIGLINRQGRMLVASAGNEGQLADRRLPGAAGGVLSVGSSNRHKQSSSFSNYGRTVDALAPGEGIIGLKDNKPISLNGTSFSSPIVAGVASLMLAVAPELVWKHVEYIIKKTATPISCSDYCPDTMNQLEQQRCKKLCCEGDKVICAAGIVNAAEAVKMASLGIPKTALIDLDDYYLPLSEHNNMRMMVTVKNWGAVSAIVRLKNINQELKIYPEQFEVLPIDNRGFPGTKEVLVYYDKVPGTELVLALIFEAASSNDPNNFTDSIEAIAEIVPDAIIGRKQYRELY